MSHATWGWGYIVSYPGHAEECDLRVHNQDACYCQDQRMCKVNQSTYFEDSPLWLDKVSIFDLLTQLPLNRSCMFIELWEEIIILAGLISRYSGPQTLSSDGVRKGWRCGQGPDLSPGLTDELTWLIWVNCMHLIDQVIPDYLGEK